MIIRKTSDFFLPNFTILVTLVLLPLVKSIVRLAKRIRFSKSASSLPSNLLSVLSKCDVFLQRTNFHKNICETDKYIVMSRTIVTGIRVVKTRRLCKTKLDFFSFRQSSLEFVWNFGLLFGKC